MKQAEVDALFARPTRRRNSVLSVYLNVDQSHRINLNRGFERQLKEMSTTLRRSFKEDPAGAGLAPALHRAEDFVSAYTPQGRGLALFIDEADGFFAHQELAFPAANQVRWDRELLLQPLANALDELETYGVVVVDRTKLRLLLVQQGEIEELFNEEISGKRVRHVKSTGPEHAESSNHNERRADNQIRENLRDVIQRVKEFFKEQEPRRLILAGTPETVAELRKMLPASIESRIIGETRLAMSAPVEGILSVVQPIAAAYERSTEIERVTEVVTTAARKGKAVVGLGQALQAINSDRVWELMYSAGFQAPGFKCSECSALFSAETPECVYCGSTMHSLSDIVERAVEHALRKEAKVEVVSGEAATVLNAAGGIGASLRRRTKPPVTV